MKNRFHTLRKACAAALAALTLFACTPFASVAQATGDLDGGLLSAINLEAVGAGGASLQDGIYFIACYGDLFSVLNVQYRKVTGGMVLDGLNYEDNELWVLKNVGGSYFTLSPVFAPGYYLAGQLNDTQLRLATGASDFNNQWKAIRESDGHYVLVNRKSGLAIDTAHGQSSTGNPVLNYYKNGYREAQSWTLGRVSEFTDRLTPASVTTVSNGLYAFLLKTNQNKCMNVQFNVKAGNGTARMCVDTYNGEENEEFYVTHRGNNCYTISPKSSPNVCLNVWAANPVAGSQLTLATYQEGDQCSLWIPYKNSDGSISWMNARTHLFLNDYGNSTTDGNPIVSYYFDDTAAGRWVLKAANSTTITSPVPSGAKFSKQSKDNSWYGYHDINRNVSTNTPVYAMSSGTAYYYQYNTNGRLRSYGYFVKLVTNNGYEIRYAHLSRFAGMSPTITADSAYPCSGAASTGYLGSRQVNTGDVLGYIGSTGNASGVHLHLEIYKNGTRIDPTSLFPNLV